MNVSLAAAVLTGLGLGCGILMVSLRLPFMRQRSFSARIEPQLRSVAADSRLLRPVEATLRFFGPLERILRALLKDTSSWLNRFNTGNAALTARLERAGKDQAAIDFRAEQLIWGSCSFVLAVVAVIVFASSGAFNLLFAVLICLGAAIFGYLLRDYILTVQITRREARMLAEFPSLAELMALAVSAGESATGALERVCRTSQGDLAQEFARILGQTRSGVPLTEALAAFSRRTKIAPLVRFTDGLIVAVERGTPLAGVLRAQAQDVRDLSKRELMEAAGKKEIAMMIPLVFGILPLTVIFAAFPGLQLLSFGF